jgi:putative redox protein
MPITATVVSPTDTLRQEVRVDGRHTLITDEPPELGGEDTAATPYELLAAALAACVVTTIRMYARRHGWEVREITVEAVFDGNARDPHASFRLHLPDDLDAERRVRLERVAQSCAVHRTLERGVGFMAHEASTAPQL